VEVYLDLVMLLNFLVDFSLLLGTNWLSGHPPGLKRCMMGAAFGGVYSGICLIPEFRFMGNLLWRLVSLLIMSWISFGFGIGMLRRAGVFAMLSMALGGIALSFGKGEVVPLLCCCGILWLLCLLGFSDPPGSVQYEQITLRFRASTLRLLALRDTGNTLKDPITGEPVLVISPEAAEKLTGLTKEQLLCPLETISRRILPGLRLIPYSSIGGGGMLLAMRFPQVQMGSRSRDMLVAFAAEGFGRGEVYQALMGGRI